MNKGFYKNFRDGRQLESQDVFTPYLYLTALHGSVSRICPRNFDAICHIFRNVATVNGFAA